MTKDEFLKKFQDILQSENIITANTNLLDLEEWDSLAMITTIAFLDNNFGVKMTFSEIENLDTVQDLMNKAGI